MVWRMAKMAVNLEIGRWQRSCQGQRHKNFAYVLVQAIKTSCHWLGGFNNKHLSQFWSLEIWDQSARGFCWGSSSSLPDGSLLPVSSLGRAERKHALVFLLTEALIPSWGLHPHNLMAMQRPPSPNTITLGLGFSHMNSWGTPSFSL